MFLLWTIIKKTFYDLTKLNKTFYDWTKLNKTFLLRTMLKVRPFEVYYGPFLDISIVDGMPALVTWPRQSTVWLATCRDSQNAVPSLEASSEWQNAKRVDWKMTTERRS
jgi:hypothetical protein